MFALSREGCFRFHGAAGQGCWCRAGVALKCRYKHMGSNLVLLNILMFVSFVPVVMLFKKGFYLFIREREREQPSSGEGQREREKQTPHCAGSLT